MGFVLKAIKLETLNIRDADFLLLDVKSWLENVLSDHRKCELGYKASTQGTMRISPADDQVAQASFLPRA